MERADEHLLFRLYYLHHLRFRLCSFASCRDHHAHLVAVEACIELRSATRICSSSTTTALRPLLRRTKIPVFSEPRFALALYFPERHLGYLVGLGQEVEYVYDVDAVGRVCCPDSEGYLFVVESLLVLGAERNSIILSRISFLRSLGDGFFFGSYVVCN